MTTTTANLTALMQTYYDKLFLSRKKEILLMDQFGQKRPLPKGEGKQIKWTRYTVLPVNTTALTEGENPAGLNLSASSVTATVEEYGDFTKISSLLSLTALDPNVEEKVELLGDQAMLSIDTLIRNAVVPNATTQRVGSKDLTAIAVTDVISTTEVRKAVRTLKSNKSMRIGGYFVGVTSAFPAYDLMGDSSWINASQYSKVTQLFEGELGKWMGVRFVETTNPYTVASTVTVYSCLIIGKAAYGITILSGAEKKIYVKNPGPSSTDNPLDRFSTVGWGITFKSKILQADWAINLQTGATA